MRILMINKFLCPRGGAETYLFRLGEQLEKMGHEVQYFGMESPENVVGNRAGAYTRPVDFRRISLPEKLRWGFRVLYSREARQKLRTVLEDFQPEVCHLNNFHYQLTPSILLEIDCWRRETGQSCTIVHTAHDYQLVCPNHMCYTGDAPCEKCLGGHYGSCIRGRCIHGSFLRSLLGAAESWFWHRRQVYKLFDRVICCSEFLKTKLDTDPILRSRTCVIRNFTQEAETAPEPGSYVLYFGRYSREKGISLLLQAARQLPQIPFLFAGAGELAEELADLPNVRDVGFQSGDKLKDLIRKARFTVVPSQWYENCPFSVLESLSLGVLVLGADIGGIPELIEPGKNGELFAAGNLESLKTGLETLWKAALPPVIYQGFSLPDYTRRLLKIYRPEGTLSVVVPVYNTQNYLDRCLESITTQTYRQLEILLIDDGSTDGSGERCDQWASRDSRIRVIHKENQGLGMARNTGLEAATGKAVCFVDSDDYLLPRTLEMASRKLLLEDRDAVVFGMLPRPIQLDRESFQGSQVREQFLPMLLQQRGNLPISSCTALYSMELVRKIRWRFPSEREIIAEDVYALLSLYSQAKSVAVLPEAFYGYRETPGSLTRRYRQDRVEAIKKFYEACLELCRRERWEEAVRRSCAAPFLGFVIGCMKQEVARGNGRQLPKMLADPLVRQALRENPEKPRWRKRLLLFAMGHSWQMTWLLLYLQSCLEKGGHHGDTA